MKETFKKINIINREQWNTWTTISDPMITVQLWMELPSTNQTEIFFYLDKAKAAAFSLYVFRNEPRKKAV